MVKGNRSPYHTTIWRGWALIRPCFQFPNAHAARPDLVPEYTVIEASLRTYPYLDVQPIFSVQCAKGDQCLAQSSYSKPLNSYVKLLRFSSQTMNWGRADAIPVLQPYQWIWHACHNHYHSIEDFVSFELYNATNGSMIAVGHKASFCLEDSICSSGGYPRYACSSGFQGISPNCGDVYGRYLDCQWIDVTDVPPGRYSLQLHVNPGSQILESDYTNNRAACSIQLLANGYIQLLSACSLIGKCLCFGDCQENDQWEMQCAIPYLQ